MALTFFQKLQVAFRVWSRRRADEAKKRDEEFLRRNVSWGQPSGAPVPATPAPVKTPALQLDLEGLQVAYLDDSGQIAYFLDMQSGDVVEIRGEVKPEIATNAARYKRVPQRGADVDDRKAFVESLEPSATRESLRANIDTNNFRKVLAGDRNVERAWYNFRNQRATTAIESWLRSLSLR